MDTVKLRELIDPVFEACGEVFIWNHIWLGKPKEPIDYFAHTREILGLGRGNKYSMGGAVLISPNPGVYDQSLFGHEGVVKELVPFLEQNGVKPIFHIYDSHGIKWVAQELVECRIARWKPFMCCLHVGKRRASYIPHDPWENIQLIERIAALQAAIPDSVIGLRAGGRNWLPITLAAVAMGIDMVGVTQKCCDWVCSRRNGIVVKNAEVIENVATIARMLGREIATPRQIKSILGFDSKAAAKVQALPAAKGQLRSLRNARETGSRDEGL